MNLRRQNSRILAVILLFGLLLLSTLIFKSRTDSTTNTYLQIDDIYLKTSDQPNEDYILEWERSHNGYYRGIATDSQGYIYLSGIDNGDYHLARYAPDGTKIWSRKHTKWSTYETSVAVDSEDYAYLCGWSFQGSTEGGGTIFLFKYNSTGDLQWERSFGTDSRAYDICVGKYGNIYITGCSWEAGANGKDLLLIKYDNEGTLKWYVFSHLSGDDCGYGVTAHPSIGFVYVTGEISGNMIFQKYTVNGEWQFTKYWNNGGNEVGKDICTHPIQDKIYISGDLGYAALVYDGMGDSILNVSGPSQNAIIVDPLGNIFVSRYVSSLKLYFSKYSPEGYKLSEIIANHQEYPQRMAYDADRNIYLMNRYGILMKFRIDNVSPDITITKPGMNEKFGVITPDMDLNIVEVHLSKTWYSLSNESKSTNNITWTGKINQSVWDLFDNGAITIHVYANDTNGNMGYSDTIVFKDKTLNYFWNLTGQKITIDDIQPNFNWTRTEQNFAWCYGSGTEKDPYILENIYLDGKGSGNCIEIKNSNASFIIRNCTLLNCGTDYENAGIRLDHAHYGTLQNNTCSNNGQIGIYIYFSNETHVFKNVLTSNYIGIKLDYGENNHFLNNTILYNSYSGIVIKRADNNIIENNTAVYNRYGIMCENSDVNYLSTNNFSVNGGGIRVEYCSSNLFSNNLACLNTNTGIYLISSESNKIIHTEIIGNGEEGIYISKSDDNEITDNYIHNNTNHGLKMYDCYNNMLLENTISENDAGGLYLEISRYNTISGNTITYNKYVGLNTDTSENNTIFDNVFIKNEINSKDDHDYSQKSFWNNSIIGNFWDDYVGDDMNGDGIGDTPYNIAGSAGSQDMLPIYDWDYHFVNTTETDGDSEENPPDEEEDEQDENEEEPEEQNEDSVDNGESISFGYYHFLIVPISIIALVIWRKRLILIRTAT